MLSRQFVKYENLEAVLHELETRLPKSGMLFNVVRLLLNNKYSTKVKTEIRVLDWDLERAVIAVIQEYEYLPEKMLLLSLPQNPEAILDNVVKGLEELIDWSRPITFGEIDPILTPSLLEMGERNLKNKVHSVEVDLFNLFILPSTPESSKTFKEEGVIIRGGGISQAFLVKQLSRGDAVKIDNFWKHSRKGTREMLEDSIEFITSAGVYHQGELISWAVTTPVGSINSVNTDETFRRKGFAVDVLNFLLVKNALNSLRSVAHVEPPNTASLNLMKKVGFEHTHDVNWIAFTLEESN